MATNPTPQPDSPKDLQLINIVDDFIHSITRRHIPDYPEAKDFMVKLGAYYTNKFLEELNKEKAKAIVKFCKDKVVIGDFKCSKHGKLKPYEVMPECSKCFNEEAQLASEDTAIKQLSKRGE